MILIVGFDLGGLVAGQQTRMQMHSWRVVHSCVLLMSEQVQKTSTASVSCHCMCRGLQSDRRKLSDSPDVHSLLLDIQCEGEEGADLRRKICVHVVLVGKQTQAIFRAFLSIPLSVHIHMSTYVLIRTIFILFQIRAQQVFPTPRRQA